MIKKEDSSLIVHPIPPLYDHESRILILGSFPSVKSRETAFFYGHPQNRFWKVLSRLLEESFPETIPDRRALLLRRHIAVWDVIASCEIRGSSDSSIRNVTPNDLRIILNAAPIRQIYTNGQTAGRLYRKYQEKVLKQNENELTCPADSITLPSTSPANAAWSLDRLAEAWSVILQPLRQDSQFP